MSYISSFLKSNWLVLIGFVAAWFFIQDYKAQVEKIATLKASLTQVNAAVSTLKEDAAKLRSDIATRTLVAIEHKEKVDELDKTATAANRILDKGKESLPWGRQPYPAYVYDAAKLLEQGN